MKKITFSFVAIIFLFSAMYIFAQDTPLIVASVSQPSLVKNKISLDIKGMDIVDVLKMLSAKANLNVVIGKNVTGRVTLFLKEVEIWDAFEIVLLANDLAYETKSGIINVMTQRDYELMNGERFQEKKQARIIKLKYAKAADIARSLSQVKTNLGRVVGDDPSNTVILIDTPQKISEMQDFIRSADLPLRTKIFSLNYAQADKLSAKLQEAITKGIGSIKIDERTNKIAITDYPQKLADITKIVSAFDEKTQQVLIDAQLIQLTPSDKFEMGVDWDYWIRKYFEVKASLPINTANTLLIGTPNVAPTVQGQYKAVIDILRTIGDTKVLSSPRIMALNNQEAKIHVGVRDAYITATTSQGASGTTVTSQSVNFVDTGIQLSVTPTINKDGFVTMKIKPEISDSTRTDIKSEGQITQIPIVSTSEAETTVMVKDGVTIIIGGLSKDKREKTVRKIPLLGDIPGLGFLFRSTSDNLTKSDLVILLTPHIMSGESTFTEFSEIKPQEGAVKRMEDGKIVTDKFSVSKENEALTLFNAPVQYSGDYYQSLVARINKYAKLNSPKDMKGEVSLNFKVLDSGSLAAEPKVIEASNEQLKGFAIKAIKDASPFEPFPVELRKKEEVFKISLSYQ